MATDRLRRTRFATLLPATLLPATLLLGACLLLPAFLPLSAPLLAADSPPTGERAPATGPPYNIVVVLSDSLRAGSLPMYGYPCATTPFLSSLVKESIVFEQQLANYPGTPVSVSQLMTGRFMPPLLMGSRFFQAPVRAVEKDLLVLPRVLGRAGYRTGIVTSHPWFDASARILEDFDEKYVIEPGKGDVYAVFEDLMPSIDAFLAPSIDSGGAFFLYLHTMDTHSPHRRYPQVGRAREEAGCAAEYADYDSEIAYTDYWTHQVYDRLQAAGLLKSTVLVFLADHGEEFNEVGPEWWNRGHGGALRRAQIHVPLLIRMPRSEHAGLRFEGVSRHIDFAPTLLGLALADRSLTEPYRLDGVDLLAGDSADDSGVGNSLAYSQRYWGLFGQDREWIYDQWEDRISRYRVEAAEFNYPRSRAVARPGPEEESDLIHALESQQREFLAAEPSRSLLEDVMIGPPGTVVRTADRGPTYRDAGEDDRWLLRPGKLLMAAPGEHPEPLTLTTPWAPGEYRVWLRLHRIRAKMGYRNAMTVALEDDGEGIAVDGEMADAFGRIDLGNHELGRTLQIRFSEPEGGVAIVGLEIRRAGSERGEAIRDDGLEDRLRALGYVE